jgi:glycerol-3-phosphate dehydrogenase
MIARGNQLMDQLIEDLDIEFRRMGELVLAFTTEEIESLKTMKKQGEHINVKGLEIIGNTDVMHLEPNVNPAVMAALYIPHSGVFNPFDLVSALYENARDNGVDVMTDTEVKVITGEDGGFILETNRGDIQAEYIVNAAGLFAEKIADMAGTGDFRITYDTKGTCLILDTSLGNIVHHIVTGIIDPKAFLRYKLVTPTFHDKILIYTSFPEPAKGIEDRSLSKRVFDVTIESAEVLVPNIDFKKYVIASYSGLTARNDRGDFIIEASKSCSAFIHAALPPPGLTCSPAVAKRVVKLLKSNGLDLKGKRGFNPYRKGIRSHRKCSPTQMNRLLGEDPSYGRVICRCEKVSEGEIVEAIRRGATTLDGVKFRTRACMGRCQTNYCGPEIANILAREQNQPVERVTKKGRRSRYVC